MVTQHGPQHVHPEAPDLIKELRQLFDDRLEELHRTALEQAVKRDNGASPMYHIDVPAGPLMVTVMYDMDNDRFTQLVARAAEEAHHERPSFTISLFL